MGMTEEEFRKANPGPKFQKLRGSRVVMTMHGKPGRGKSQPLQIPKSSFKRFGR